MIRVAIAVVARPSLWPTAVRQWRRTCAPRWWTRAPFLPLPDAGYVRFRTVTQYGSADHALDPHDVVDYLTWCRRWDRQR